MMKYVDVVQVGARNMQNFELLKSVGRIGKPVLLKRGLSATIEEWLMSAEYILSEGNDQVILCERGIRTFERYTRNTLDLTAVPVIKKLTHLPIIVDPSHATGIRDKVSPMARASIAAGADGLIVEVHTEPDKALVRRASEPLSGTVRATHERPLRHCSGGGKTARLRLPRQGCRHETAPGRRAGRPATVAYSGVPGSFSHKACMQFFGDEVPLRNCSSFREVFELGGQRTGGLRRRSCRKQPYGQHS